MTVTERNIAFFDGKAYDITWTMAIVAEMFDRGEMPRYIMEALYSVLSDLRFVSVHDMDMLVDHPAGGYVTLGRLFEEIGYECGSTYHNPIHIADVDVLQAEESIDDIWDLEPDPYYSDMTDEDLVMESDESI